MAYECVSHICSAICSCLLGFNFRQEQRPTTLQIQTSSVTTNTEIIPSSASSVTNTTEITPPPPSVATDTEIIPLSASSVTTTITEVIPPPPSSPLATSSTSLSSSSSAPSGKLTYDVFLSFRGTDTRNKFTDHLYTALVQKGIHTFRDDEELESGDSIGPTLLKAIKESRYVIVVLSQSYADSAWCLDELAEVVECKKTMGQIVIPVFYDVHPFEVRRQKVDRFNQAFEKHQKRNPDKLKRWKDALLEVSNISGWHLHNRSEAKIIQGIVESVSTKLNKIISTSEGLVGMDSHLDKMLSYLDIQCHDDVRIIGICGMGGIGKSTIAQVVFNRIRVHFEGASFLRNVREEMKNQGEVHLQKQLLSDLLTRNVDVDNIEMGKNTMRDKLKTKKVLIILDDVDSVEQLEVLCDRGWYGPRSRIIITTRNMHIHTVVEGDKVYNVDPLSDYEALQLFKMEAFIKKDESVRDEYLKLSDEFVKYTGGLPLAIKVLGASVKGRSVKLWLNALKRLKKNPDEKIMNVLKVSFDGLTKTEKSIFLDIACFLKGKSLDRVRRILQGSDAFCPDLDLEVLQEKYMVVLFGKKLWMHDLIQEMGREVVREKYPEEPEKRSRLWIQDEILEVFDENKATGAIQSILLQGPTKDDVDPNDTFSKMTKLRLLKISNVKFSGDIKYLSKKLQFLYWDECPLNSFPEKFQPDYLVELHMRSSFIKQLWTGERGWSMLQYINLTGSQYLMSTPDFTEVPELETLVLQDCTNLVEIHPSLGFLKKLKHLDLRNCKSIESIPPFIALESLEMLLLSFCSGLKTFPEIAGNMKSSLHLHLDGTNIEELPPSIERLTGLTMLNLKDSKNLLRLPNTIRYLTSMKYLNLTGCSKLDDIAENLTGMKCLEKLFIGGTSIRDLSFIASMKNLRFISCKGCKCLVPESFKGLASLSLIELDLSYCDLWDGAFLNDLVTLTTLRELRLSGNCFVRLPENISRLSKLESLELNNCRQLQLLPKKLPSSLVSVCARDCTSLTDYPNQIKELTTSNGVAALDSRHSAKCSAADSSENGEGFKHHSGHPLQSPRQMETSKTSNLVFAEDEIPEWFGSISTRNEISIPIPGNLITDYKWKGFAACAIFTVEGHTALSVIQPVPDFSNYSYQMTLETDVMSLGPEVLLMKDYSPSLGSVSHLLLIFYMSRSAVPQGALYEASELRATFETTNPSIVVQKCAIRLVYDEDEGWSSKVHPRFGWGRQIDEDAYVSGSTDWVNHSWEREKFIPPLEEESTVLLRKNLESVLPRYLEAVNNVMMFGFHLSGSPGWFHKESTFVVPKSTRSRSLLKASIKLPENLHKSKKWMGFAIFASLVHEVGQKNEEEKFRVFVELRNEEDKLARVSLLSSPELERARPLSEEYHQLLVFDIPRERIPETLFTQTEMDHLGIMIVGSPLVKVQRFGFRIVYQEDIQGFSDTIIRCIQRDGSLQPHDKFFVEEWIQLIRLHGARIERMTERDSRTPRQKYIDLHSQKYRKYWDWSDPACSFSCGFERTEISKWKRFMPSITKGNSTECRLPLNVFDDDNWLGFAVCCWLSHDQYPNISLGSALDSENVLLEIRLHSDVELDCLFDFKIQMVLGKLKLTLFHYLRRTVIHSKIWRLWKLVRVTIRLIDYPCLTVHSCAIRLLYKEDIEDLVETLTLAELP